MTRSLILFFFLFLHPSFTQGQDAVFIHPDSLVSDIRILATTIRENHPMMYMYTTRERFDNLTERTIAQVRKGTTFSGFYAALSKLVGSVGCGHTYVYPTRDAEARLSFNNDLPFDIRIMDTSMFVSGSYGSDYTPYEGAEIYRINEVPVDRLITSAFNYISADGYNQTYKAYTLGQKFTFYLNLLMGNPDSLDFESSAGNFTVRYPTHFIKPDREEPETVFHELTDVPHSVVLTVPHFDYGKKTIGQCFKYLDEHDVKNLVIDLRNNGGGNGNIGALLIAHIVDSTLTYYLDKKTPPLQYKQYLKKREGFIGGTRYFMADSTTKRFYYKVKPRERYNFDGQVYVLINGGTFSTGSYVAAVLDNKAGAICAGEETGGSAYAIGGGVIGRLELPNSGLQIRFPLYRWMFNVSDENKGRGVIPDHAVTHPSGTKSAGRDVEMMAVSELIKAAGLREEK